MNNHHRIENFNTLSMTFFLLVLLLTSPLSLAQSFPGKTPAAYLLLGPQNQPALAAHPDQRKIPASTTKLVTAWLALRHWGAKHRFMTPFYLDRSTQTLWIKGSGDPYLVSDEIRFIAKRLADLGLQDIKHIAIDHHLFKPNLKVPGSSTSTNPYDAIPSPLAANFNSLALAIKNGQVISAEAETPLTEFARTQAGRIKGRKERINTGFNQRDSERHFAQLLTLFLRQQGINIESSVIWGQTPAHLPVFYRHYNRRNLADMIRPMMKYSTNFIANQLALMLAADTLQRPVDFKDVQHYMESTLKNHFHWQDFVIREGAGLSRDNRLSPRQLTELLLAFNPWRTLLPEVAPRLYAKSGTLNQISTLAGYHIDAHQHWRPFALMLSTAVSHRQRHRIIQTLMQSIDTPRLDK